MTTYLLSARYDRHQEFYGKAIVTIMDNGDKILTSYTTQVAQIKDGVATVNGTYSPTTLRHIKEFLKQNNFDAYTKKQIEEDYMG